MNFVIYALKVLVTLITIGIASLTNHIVVVY